MTGRRRLWWTTTARTRRTSWASPPTAAPTRSSARSTTPSRRRSDIGRSRPRVVIGRKTEAETEGMARAGALLGETLPLVAEQLEPGIEMRDLDRIADEHI